MLRCAVLFSGAGTTAQAILRYTNIVPHTKQSTLKPCYSVRLCICNNPQAPGIVTILKDVDAKQSTAMHITPSQGMSTAQWTQLIQPILLTYAPDLIVLAGFMRVLDAEFLQYWRNRIINIHPSLLPAYKGLHTHARVLESGDHYHGFSVHMVTAQVDDGPIIGFKKVPVHTTDNANTLQQRIQEQERYWYPQIIQLIAIGRLQLTNDLPYLDNTPLPKGGVELCKNILQCP